MTSSPIWRLAPGQRLLHRCWDGECVLYNDLSGDTHLLDEFALALLQQLQAQPQSAVQLADCFDVDADGAPQPRLREFTVEGLFEVGLQEHDGVLVLAHIDDVRSLAAGDSRAEGLRLRFDDALAAPQLARRAVGTLPPGLQLRD